MDSSSDDEFFDCKSEPLKYYAVSCQKDKGKGLVTVDINEARLKLKNSRNSRLCSFYDPLEAKKFAENPLIDAVETEVGQSANKKKSVSQKKISDPFPNATLRDLNALKSAIETSNLEKTKQLVWNNPRHLVTESDSPTLLHGRFRHNAIHVAVTFNQAQIIRFILEAISQDGFWLSVYPTADAKCNTDRMQRVLDMYLNSPEIGNLETPLHLAAKFGNAECLRALLEHELTDVSLRNKFGLRADEIICHRYIDLLKEERTTEISQIFSEKFVVLFEGIKPQVSEPMTHCQLLRLLRDRNEGFQFNPISPTHYNEDLSLIMPSGIVRAYIGPLPEIKARQLYCRWSVLNAEDAKKFEEIRRSDFEKGMECHGRYLATLFGVPWREFWNFLDAYLDFGTNEGLSKLEIHLEKMNLNESPISCNKTDYGQSTSFSVITTLDKPKQQSSTQSNTGMFNSLIRLFSRMTLHSNCSDNVTQSPIKTSQCIPSNLITSTPLKSNKTDSLRIQQMPFNSSLIGNGFLTPTDRQVRKAILSSSKGHHLKYPFISSWLHNLSEIDPQEDTKSSFYPANGFISMSTPIKSNNFKKPQIPNMLQCLSPLSQIELPD